MKYGHRFLLLVIASIASFSSHAEKVAQVDMDGIDQEQYDAFIRNLEGPGSDLATKCGSDAVLNAQVVASLTKILEATPPQVFKVKCVEKTTLEKSVLRKDGSTSYSTADARPEGIARFDAEITHEGKGRFSMVSDRTDENGTDAKVKRFTASRPVTIGSFSYTLFKDTPSKYNYLRSSNETDLSIRLFPPALKIGDNPKGDFSFTINPLSTDSQVYFKVEKLEPVTSEKNDTGDVTKTHRRTVITCE